MLQSGMRVGGQCPRNELKYSHSEQY